MEQSYSWENWPLDMEMGEDDDRHRDLLEDQCQTTVEEEFLRDILSQPAFSSESESQAPFVSSSSDVGSAKSKRAPRTYILSFDKSTIIPATPPPTSPRSSKSNSSRKRTLQLHEPTTQPKPNTQAQPGKRGRIVSQTLDRIMAERKRRQELTQRFIALSATIPGLNKTDKSSILGEAIDYVKQLQERVTKLEQRNKRGKESMIILKKSEVCNSSETNSEDCCRASEMLPVVEARVMENEVLIDIHCEKEDGVELKIFDHLENLHLSVTASSVLPFGNSTLGITIIAQMGDSYEMKVNDLVKKLRQVLLNHTNVNTDPY